MDRDSRQYRRKKSLERQYFNKYSWNNLKDRDYHREVRKYKRKLSKFCYIFTSIFGISSSVQSKIQKDLKNADYAYDKKLTAQVQREIEKTPQNQRHKKFGRIGSKISTKKKANTGHNQYKWDISKKRKLICIHDVSGYDSLDASKFKNNDIDIRPGATSHLGKYLKVALSYSTWIEHVVLGKGDNMVKPNRKLNTFMCRKGKTSFDLEGLFGHNHIILLGGEVKLYFHDTNDGSNLECFAKSGSEKDLVIRFKNGRRRNTVKLVNYFRRHNRTKVKVYSRKGKQINLKNIMF